MMYAKLAFRNARIMHLNPFRWYEVERVYQNRYGIMIGIKTSKEGKTYEGYGARIVEFRKFKGAYLGKIEDFRSSEE